MPQNGHEAVAPRRPRCPNFYLFCLKMLCIVTPDKIGSLVPVGASLILLFLRGRRRRSDDPLGLDGGFEDAHPHTLRQLDQERIVADLPHRTEEPADRHDLVSAPDARDQPLVLLLALALGTNDEEVKDEDEYRI